MISSHDMQIFRLSLVLLLAALPGHPFASAAEEKKGGPAKLTGAVKEADLATITLTPKAEERLAIETATVERRKVARTRTFGGEAIIPARVPTGGEAGKSNAGGQSILSILPSLTPTDLIRIAEAQVDADGQVEQAKVAHEAAEAALARAEELLKNKAGSERAVEETRTALNQAAAALRTAQAKRDLLAAPVLDVMNPKQLWVRVPVYVGDLPKLNTETEARVAGLADAPGSESRPAKLVIAPPSANATASTVDLFYEVSNEDLKLRPGQKVGVSVPLQDPEESLVVPWSAVVHDIHGGAWVYEQLGPQTYAHRRVQVRAVVGKDAVLESGPAPGAKVVTVGVAELFGTEFGVGK
jgi:Tfp pilus assembly protein PilX